MSAAERQTVLLHAEIRWLGHNRTRVAISNISDGGLRFSGHANLPEGLPIEIDLPGLGWTHARTVWSHKDDHGVCFDQLIDTRVVRQNIGRPAQPAHRHRATARPGGMRRFV